MLKLHIVCFDVPYPPDYGGAIDVFYKIRSLYEAGAELYLHCFQYGRGVSPELERFCCRVWYYPRKTGLPGLSYRVPYIVYSRRNKALLHHLQEIKAPILFEGLHTTYYLDHPSLKDRLKMLRNHNVEHDYYRLLSERESSVAKRVFFREEARRLFTYERGLQAAQVLMPISAADTGWFAKAYPGKKVVHLPGFHPFEQVVSATGKGSYCLYQGNLAHPENKEAALFLLQQVFPGMDIPLVIAGRAPDQDIIDACGRLTHCRLIADPDEAAMDRLIRDAQLHILPTFQASGLKLKLLYALYAGRHVLANERMLSGTGLEALCAIAGSATAFKEQVLLLMDRPFGEEDKARRASVLGQSYNNARNARLILDLLSGSAL